MVLNFLENDKLSEDDIEELREILNKRTTKGINKYVCPILYTIFTQYINLININCCNFTCQKYLKTYFCKVPIQYWIYIAYNVNNSICPS